MDKYLLGKDGILFLNNDSNAVLNQLAGKAVFRPGFLKQLAEVHLQRRRRCAEFGCAYFHIIVPNKETSLRAYLPDDFIYEQFGQTPTKQYLEGNPEVARFTFYDADCLGQGTSPTEFYPRQDSHWNTRGAVAYFKRALTALGLPDAGRLNDLMFRPKHTASLGDLGRHASRDPEDVSDIALEHPENRILFAGNISNRGFTRHQISVTAGLSRRLFCLHDSFTQLLTETIGNVWAEVLAVHFPDFDWELAEAYRPDVILFIQIERFLPRQPVDGIDIVQQLRELSAEKNVPPITADYIAELIAKRRGA